MMCNNVTSSLPPDTSPQRPADKVSSSSDEDEAQTRRLIAEAAFVRDAIAQRHSDKFVRLFEFMRDRTTQGRPPSEAEIASEVLSAGRKVDARHDAAVRVCVHRLRKTMDEIYADRTGPRLLIPRGEYSVRLTDQDSPSDDSPAEPSREEPSGSSSPKPIWLALALLLISGVVLWGAFNSSHGNRPTTALARSPLWHSMANDGRPTMLVLGDYYLFARSSEPKPANGMPPRLVWDPSINGREDLDVYLMRHPEEVPSVADIDQHYVPTSAITVLGRVYAALTGVAGDPDRSVSVMPASQLTPDVLKSSDIVYLGQLSGLGPLLRDPLFDASGFGVGASYDELVDNVSGERFRSDGVVMTDERTPRRDYGYIASLPGPSGNNIVVIAGTRDPGLLEMAQLASDPGKLKSLKLRGNAAGQGFEALYQVRTIGSLNVGSKLLISRPLHSHGIWDKSETGQRFPNDTFEGPGHAKR